jgi:nucleotide-binding universal stress UspA family protein
MQFRRVLIAVDTSPIAAHAADVGIQLAHLLKAELAFVHVVDPAPMLGSEGAIPPDELVGLLERDAKGLLSTFRMQAGLEPPPVEFIRRGAPATEVVQVANEWHAEMIVIGTHGRGRVAQLLLGSVAQGVLRHASCPVVVVGSQE